MVPPVWSPTLIHVSFDHLGEPILKLTSLRGWSALPLEARRPEVPQQHQTRREWDPVTSSDQSQRAVQDHQSAFGNYVVRCPRSNVAKTAPSLVTGRK